jgi:hypothetical protein
MLREHAFDSVMERQLFSIELDSPSEIPIALGVPVNKVISA